jgi:hypothetical protein
MTHAMLDIFTTPRLKTLIYHNKTETMDYFDGFAAHNSEVNATPDFDFNETVDNGFNRVQLKQKMQPKRAVPRSTTRALLSTDFEVLRENEMNSFDTGLVSKKSSSRQYAAPAMMLRPHSAAMPRRELSARDLYIIKHKGDMTPFGPSWPRPEPNYSCLRQYTNIDHGYKPSPMVAKEMARIEQKCQELHQRHSMGM